MYWTRAQLKSNAKLMIKRYWIGCVVVSLVMALVTFSGGRPRTEYQIRENQIYELPDLNDIFGYADDFTNDLFGGLPHALEGWFPLIFAVTAIAVVLSAIVVTLFGIFVGNIFKVGGCRFYLHNIHSRGELSDLLFGFRNQYGNIAAVMFLRDLYIFLWSLLFVIPGIVKAYQYRLVPYLLADNPEMDSHTAMETSRSMMEGEKWNTFVLDLSFIWWNILASIIIVAILWVNPYKDAVNAELYTALKTKAAEGWR